MRKEMIYTSGACGNVSKKERDGWRNYINEYLTDLGFNVYHTNHHFNYEHDSDLPMKVIMDTFLSKIDECDIFLINLNNAAISCGTNIEFGYALAKNKLIYGIRGDNTYPYLEERCSIIFNNIEEACDFIARHF